jgi:transposase-like protein
MRKHYSAQLKAQIVQEILKEDKTIGQIASEHGIHPTMLHRWKAQALAGLPRLFNPDDKAARKAVAQHEEQVHELYAEIGRLTTQLNWLKKKSGLDPES